MTLDHLVYATPNLDTTVAEIEQQLDVRMVEGGRHPGLGTRNRLLGLGGRAYLEIIGPDPEQEPPAGPRPFGIDTLTMARLVTWAAAVTDIDAAVARARERGYDPGDPQDMSRHTPSGELLSWRLTPPSKAGLVPFLIDWGTTRHPTETDLPTVELTSFRARHPDPEAIGRDLSALGVHLDLEHGTTPTLTAVLRSPRGSLTLT
ncbi:VOC family protein [Nonomuraea sp. NPDC049309]|uniref:VOC family protein n=1 Tax=Nonomuraea sp. NPDC049309 TaxID=3364350 RepID=UPI0037138EAB